MPFHRQKGPIEIFYPKEEDLSEESYLDDYFYLFGPCDVRWGFKPTVTRMMEVTNIKILEVRGNTSTASKALSFQGCYYFKNYNKNLIVLSSVDFNNRQDYEETDKLLQNIISTLVLF